MHIKRIVSPLGLTSRVAQRQEQLWSNPRQQPPQLCSAPLGALLWLILEHLLSQRQAQTHGQAAGSQRAAKVRLSCRDQRRECRQLTAWRR